MASGTSTAAETMGHPDTACWQPHPLLHASAGYSMLRVKWTLGVLRDSLAVFGAFYSRWKVQQQQAGELLSPSYISGSVSECGQHCLRQPIRSCFIYFTVLYSTPSFCKTLLLGDCFPFFLDSLSSVAVWHHCPEQLLTMPMHWELQNPSFLKSRVEKIIMK